MIDFKEEQMLTVAEAAEWLASRNMKIGTGAIRSWITNGNQGVKLEAIKLGGVVFTSVESIERFVRRLNGEDPKVVTTRRREREKKEAYEKARRMFGA
ncbi:DUF1580 domain-containing protein [Singulisphaera sp. PoT]|uniref:DUF1580 domain-containing protein n=1 Tax=Singulisphaera sp. PoT TaxID=3411797 RepID=UPI003BF56134